VGGGWLVGWDELSSHNTNLVGVTFTSKCYVGVLKKFEKILLKKWGY